jgi:hypothetical protein
MVLLCGGVECSGKIAMTALRSALVAMGLLPIHHLSRRILLGARITRISLILKQATRRNRHQIAMKMP